MSKFKMNRRKTIVITGASSGVGLDICKHFDSIGWRVIGLGRRVAALKVGKVEFIQADARAWVLYNIMHKTNTIDVVVNSAAIFTSTPLYQMKHSEIVNMVEVNLMSVILFTRQCLHLMKKGARIINISSVAGTHGIENQSVYSSTKAGINGFFESLQVELLPRGILLSTINAGGINTPLWDKHKYKGDRKKLLKTSDIVSLVDYIVALPQHVVLKSVTLYPTNEIH